MWPSSAVSCRAGTNQESLLQYRDGTIDQSDGNLLGHPVVDLQQVAITGLSLGYSWKVLAASEQKKMEDHCLIGESSPPLNTVHAHNVPAPLVASPQFAQEVARKELSREEQVCQLGQLMKQSREDEGMTLRELALETWITTPVIETLERGWSDRLPEHAYLASMLSQLERRPGADAGHVETGPSRCCGPAVTDDVVAASHSPGQHRRVHRGRAVWFCQAHQA